MGAGKTAFAQGFAKALGVNEPVTSPTFTIVHTYPPVAAGRRARSGRDPLAGLRDSDATSSTANTNTANTNTVELHHADLYRLDHTTEVADLALDELLDGDGIVLVEWGDVVDLGPHLRVELIANDHDEFERDIEVSTHDTRWNQRWPRLVAALDAWADAA